MRKPALVQRLNLKLQQLLLLVAEFRNPGFFIESLARFNRPLGWIRGRCGWVVLWSDLPLANIL